MLTFLRLLLIASGLFLLANSLYAEPVSTNDTGSPSIPYWIHVSTDDEALPNPSSSEQQTAVLIVDLDQNGINDFVVGARKQPGPSLVWFRWEGTSWTRYVIDNQALDIEAGGAYFDIDADGDLDLVMGGDSKSNQIWWWENPYPHFEPNTGWTRRLIKDGGEKIHHDQIFGDFDHDGQVELVFWNQGSWNQSSGKSRLMMAEIPADPLTAVSWQYAPIFEGFGEGLTQGDIEQDGQIDLIAGGYWFKFEGNSTFTPYAIDAGYTDTRIAVGDLLENGRLEVVMVRGDGAGPLIWYSCADDPSQASCWQPTTLLDDVDHGHSLEITDLNGDNQLDIFVGEMRLNSNNPDAKMWAFYNHGNGTFANNIIASGFGVHEAKVGDLNGDSYPDILGKPYNWQTPRLDIWFNTPNNPFGSWERHLVDEEKPAKAVFILSADLNGDQWADIVTGGWWYKNPALTGSNWEKKPIGSPLNDMLAVLDIDQDGDIDILGSQGQGSQNSQRFAWAENDGLGNFTIHKNISQAPQKGFLQGVQVTDIDQNESMDILLSWNNGVNGIQMLTIPENPTANTWPISQISTLSLGEELDAEDIDDDGDLDILLGTVWLENKGDSWASHTLFTPSGGEPDRVQLADIDGDGDLDGVVGYGHGETTPLVWYEQPTDPTNTWQEHLIDTLISPLSLDVLDYDGDGDQDIVVGEHDLVSPDQSRLVLYENLGPIINSWRPHLLYTGDEHHDGAQFVDIDQDQDLDVISIGWTHGRVLLYENNSNDESVFSPPILPDPEAVTERIYLPLLRKP
ncbi:MAG: VCBS repeat-containing protein [Chloroflexota bacterium]